MIPMTVDVHTHFFPAGLGDLATSTRDPRWPSLRIDERGDGRIMQGDDVFRAVAPTCWDVPRRCEAMDAHGIDVHVLLPVPITLTTWAEPALAAEFARRQNDLLAEAAAMAPERFRWFGSLPLQDPEASVAELERARTKLGMAGVEIGTEVAGCELDDQRLRPFFAAAQAFDVPVFVHPTDTGGAIRRRGQPYDFGLGMLTDTAMAAAGLVFGGVLDEFPALRVGLAHGCGTFPWAVPRLTRGASLGGPLDLGHVDELVRRLWADTLVFDSAHLRLLLDRFGPDHLLVGSDFPFYPASWGGPVDVLDAAVDHSECTSGEADAIKEANAWRFLGSHGSAVE